MLARWKQVTVRSCKVANIILLCAYRLVNTEGNSVYAVMALQSGPSWNHRLVCVCGMCVRVHVRINVRICVL